MAQQLEGKLVEGPYKPIHRNCAIYFLLTVIYIYIDFFGLNPEGFHGPSHVLTKTLPISKCYKKDIVKSEQPALQIPAPPQPPKTHPHPSARSDNFHWVFQRVDFAGGISATKTKNESIPNAQPETL